MLRTAQKVDVVCRSIVILNPPSLEGIVGFPIAFAQADQTLRVASWVFAIFQGE